MRKTVLPFLALSFAVTAARADGPAIPREAALRAFREAALASDEDAGRLWGRPIGGPLLFVDPATREVVANVADAAGALHAEGGVFTGVLPPNVPLANTAVDWSGTRWAMVLWPAVGSTPVAIRRLLLHESWHRIQPELGLAAAEGDNAHLDSLEGRYWLLLELRALARALRATDAKPAIADALAFRAKRRALFPDAAANERALEANEGLAEFTGWALRGTGAAESRRTFADNLEHLDPAQSLVRSFAYQTGPAYGLLLDTFAPSWRASFRPSSDFADALRTAAALPAALPVAAQRAKAYDGAALRASEESRERERVRRVAMWRARLVDAPLLEIPMTDTRFSFDPGAVVPIGAEGNAYPSLTLSGPWGTLDASDGARITSDWSRIYVPATSRSRLQLTAGWVVGKGDRVGDWRLMARE